MGQAWCCRRRPPSFVRTLKDVPLNVLQKSILEERYVHIIRTIEGRCFRIALLFHTGRFVVTVGSLLVPALLSIQYTNVPQGENPIENNNETMAYRIYWTTWVVSLLVTMFNGVLSIFKIDKKYYFLHTTLEQLNSEGWQYIGLTGRYSGFHTPTIKATHENQFIYFCSAIEKIKMRQVEEEYYKLIDSAHGSSNVSNTRAIAGQAQTAGTGTQSAVVVEHEKLSIDSLIPPTPAKSLLEQANKLPPELLRQLLPYMTQGAAAPPAPAQEAAAAMAATAARKSEESVEGGAGNGAKASNSEVPMPSVV